MKPELQKSIIHGTEALAVLVLSFVIDYFLVQIAPQLPQGSVLLVVVTLLSALAKYLRASPKVKIPDYVNGP